MSAAAARGRGVRRSPSFGGMVRALMAAHRSSYLVMCLAVCAASLLVCATLQVDMAGRAFDGRGSLAGMSTYRREMASSPYVALGTSTGVALATCLVVSVFLVLSSVTFLVQERRREYGMMRLTGAGRGRIVAMELCEFAIPLAVADLLGCLLGCALTGPVAAAFARSVQFAETGMQLHARVRVSAALITFALMLATCLVGVWLAVRWVGSARPLSLLAQEGPRTRGIGRVRAVAAVLLLAGCVVLGFGPMDIPLDSRSVYTVVLLIVDVYLAAPWLVSRMVSLIGLAAQRTAGGPGLLARQRARRQTAGSVAVALPVVMVLTIIVSFLGVMRAGSAGNNVLNLFPLRADVILTSDTPGQEQHARDAVGRLGGRSRAANVYQTQQWAMKGSDQSARVGWADAGELSGTDPRASVPRAVKGSLSDLGPGRVAVNRDSYNPYVAGRRVGDTIRLLDRHDHVHAVRVVAVIDPPPGLPDTMDVLALDGTLPQLGESDYLTVAVAASSPGQVPGIVDALRMAGIPGASVETRGAYTDSFVQSGLSGQLALPIMIAGGALLALIFLVQSIAITLGERRDQDHRLNQLGVQRRAVTATALLEIAVDVTSGAVIALLAVAFMEGVVALGFVRAGIALRFMPIPVGAFLTLTAILLLVALLATLACSHLTQRHARTSQ